MQLLRTIGIVVVTVAVVSILTTVVLSIAHSAHRSAGSIIAFAFVGIAIAAIVLGLVMAVVLGNRARD